eukprot:jgi/Galph1/4477/GphlegSOOS_G3157.1
MQSETSNPSSVGNEKVPRRVARPVFSARGKNIQWNSLRPDEKDAVLDCATIAGLRAATGFGFVCLDISRLQVVPRWAGLLSVSSFGLVAAYAAALTATPTCIKTIRELPESPLAEALNETLEDWRY